MEKHSSIRFNPVTGEIEVGGSELFVKKYFKKLQAMISGSPQKTVTVKNKSKTKKTTPKKKVENKAKVAKVSPAKKVRKVIKKGPIEKKVTNVERVIGLIQSSTEGISIVELKKKTGLTGQQIAYVINRAAKKGKIRKMNRGIWCGGSVSQEPKVE
jgi:hypothetical protein